MRIFITGGTGFLGSHFISQASKAGHDLVALRRESSKPAQKLEHQPKWLNGSLCDISVEDLSGYDALVHFAAHGVSPQKTDWQTAIDINVHQSSDLISKACAAGISKILLCGSCFEYGQSGNHYERIPVTAPLQPTGAYAASKAAFSVIAQSMATESRSEFVLLRPFHFYGEGQHEANFWPSLRRAALSGQDFEMTAGEQLRDFQPVENTAESFLQTLAQWPGNKGNIHVANLGSGQATTLAKFATRLWKEWNARGQLKIGALPYRENEVMRFLPQI